MFFFGDHEQTAQLYLDNALTIEGPKVPDVHFEDMEEQDLRNAFAYLYIALKTAYNDDADEGVVEVILRDYDAVFQALAEVSENFRDKVKRGRHQYLPGYDPRTVAKYQELAGVA